MDNIYLNSCDCGACPYLPDAEWQIEQFCADSLDPGFYEAILSQGFRRSGNSFYRNACPGCTRCLPIRLDVKSFKISRSQRRVWNINRDIEFSYAPAAFRKESFDLYQHYIAERHGGGDELNPEQSYTQFLIDSPLPDSALISDYRLPDGSLAGNGYIDVLPEGLSSVYFAFDPGQKQRSLGVFSVLKELELAAKLGKRWYYLGFWVSGSPKMDYKANYRPFELALGGTWRIFEDRSQAVSILSEARAE